MFYTPVRLEIEKMKDFQEMTMLLTMKTKKKSSKYTFFKKYILMLYYAINTLLIGFMTFDLPI